MDFLYGTDNPAFSFMERKAPFFPLEFEKKGSFFNFLLSFDYDEDSPFRTREGVYHEEGRRFPGRLNTVLNRIKL